MSHTMRWTAPILLILCSGCHVARATVTYRFDEPTVAITLEPTYERERVHYPIEWQARSHQGPREEGRSIQGNGSVIGQEVVSR